MYHQIKWKRAPVQRPPEITEKLCARHATCLAKGYNVVPCTDIRLPYPFLIFNKSRLDTFQSVPSYRASIILKCYSQQAIRHELLLPNWEKVWHIFQDAKHRIKHIIVKTHYQNGFVVFAAKRSSPVPCILGGQSTRYGTGLCKGSRIRPKKGHTAAIFRAAWEGLGAMHKNHSIYGGHLDTWTGANNKKLAILKRTRLARIISHSIIHIYNKHTHYNRMQKWI